MGFNMIDYKQKDKTNKDCPKCSSKLYNEIILRINQDGIKRTCLTS